MNELYSDYQVKRISPEGQDFFFGYYDLNAYDKRGKKHLCNIPPFIDKIPEKEDVLKLGIIDLETGKVDVFAETTAWNFQQGALLQWHNTKENVVFYNERKGNEYVTVQYDLSIGKKTYSPEKIESMTEKGRPVGLLGIDVWSNDSPSKKYADEQFLSNANINTNHVKLYNEFTVNPTCEIKPEEPVCCQELYGVLDRCLQEVLTDANADCAKVIEKANNDFQLNYLNNL